MPNAEDKIPAFVVPDSGQHIWDWWRELNQGVDRGGDGYFRRVTWLELRAWANTMGHIVHPWEYAILRAVDSAYCDARDELLQARRDRDKAK